MFLPLKVCVQPASNKSTVAIFPTVFAHVGLEGLEKLNISEWHSQVGSWQGDSTVYTQLAHEFKNLRFPKYFPIVQLWRYIVTKNNNQKLLTS